MCAYFTAQVREPGACQGNVVRAAAQTTAGGVTTLSEQTSVCSRLVDAQVSYVSGGSRYTDTVAGGVLAAVYPTSGGGTVVTFDVTTQTWTTFILPALGGTATLWICASSALDAIAATQDIIPLDVVSLETVVRWQPVIAGPNTLYGFLEGYGVMTCVDPTLKAWTLAANSGLPTAANPDLALATAQVLQPSTQCLQPMQPIAQFFSGGGTLAPSRLFPNGARVQGASQMSLSYLSPTRLWCVCGTGSGATPTTLFESNDNGASWTAITTPLPDGTLAYNQVCGVCATGTDGLYITVAYGPNRDKVAVCYAARTGGAYPSWTTTTVLDLTSLTLAQHDTHTNQTGYITGAVVACDAVTPGKCVLAASFLCAAGGSPSAEAWGAAILSATSTGTAGSPTWSSPGYLMGDTDAPYGGIATKDVQSEQLMGIDALGGVWTLVVHNTPSMQVRVVSSSHWDGTTLQIDDWPHGLNYNAVSVVNTVRADRSCGQWGWLSPVTYGATSLSDDGQSPPHLASNLTTLQASIGVWQRAQSTSAVSTACGALLGQQLSTGPATVGPAGLPSSATALHAGTPNWPALAGLCCSDYSAPRTLVGLVYGPTPVLSPAGTGVLVLSVPTDAAVNDAGVLIQPVIAGLSSASAEPISVRARWNATLSAIATPTAPGTPTITAPVSGSQMADSAQVTWTQPTGTITHYQMQIASDALCTSLLVDVLLSGPQGVDEGMLAFGTTYYVRARAWNQGSPGPWSTVVDFSITGHITTVVGNGSTILLPPLQLYGAYPQPSGKRFPVGAVCVGLAHSQFAGTSPVLLFTSDHAIMAWDPLLDVVWLVAGFTDGSGTQANISSTFGNPTIQSPWNRPYGLIGRDPSGVVPWDWVGTDLNQDAVIFEQLTGAGSFFTEFWEGQTTQNNFLTFGTNPQGNGGDFGSIDNAQFNAPRGVCYCAANTTHGHALYIIDTGNNRIRNINNHNVIFPFAGDPGGVAGNTGDGGPASSCTLNAPTTMLWKAVGGGGTLFISDTGNNRVRAIDVNVSFPNVITNYAGQAGGGSGFGGDGGLATSATLHGPTGLALSGSFLFIADTGNHCIRAVNLSTNIITTVAGTPTLSGFAGDDGLATAARLSSPTGLDYWNGVLYIADTANARIRAVTDI